MPFITIDTNAKIKISKPVLADLSRQAAKILGKPEAAMIVKINGEKNMVFGGDEEALGALIEVKSIGYGNNKQRLVEALTRFAVEELNAEQKYVSMHLVDMPAANVGENGQLRG